MYQIENSRQVLEGRGFRRALRRPAVSGTVILLGLNSFFTDISSEMVSSILPVYLLFSLRLTPLDFGFIDGLYQGGSALVRVASGIVADRWQRPKEVAAVGYGLSALCKLGLLVVRGPWLALTGLILVDRIGKGIRTAPRDAMISLSSSPAALGTAFGVHRALDTAGAMLGPFLAFGLLWLLPDAFDVVFAVSFFAAVLGLGLLVLFVKNPRVERSATAPRVSIRSALRQLRAPGFGGLVAVGSILALGTVSDSFLYLALQDRAAFSLGLFPLLFVATALVYMILALPMGRLADRFGARRIFLAGYAVLGLVYLSVLLPLGGAGVLAAILLLGAYYAMTDGVLMALASRTIAPELRASGLGLLTTATGLARLVASVAFGAAWSIVGVEATLVAFLVILGVGWLVGMLLLGRTQPVVAGA